MSGHILVIGAALLDTKGKPTAGLEPGTSNPGSIRRTRGGTARNIAENLGRLGLEVILISAVGEDQTGRQLLEATAEAGVNLDFVLSVPEYSTGGYIALLDNDGTLSVALDDTRVMEKITGQLLYRQRRLFRDAALIFLDGSLTPAALQTAMKLAQEYAVPVAADPSSTRLVHKMRPYLPNLSLIVPNEVEACAFINEDFAGFDPETSLAVARGIFNQGVQKVVITLSDFGLVYLTADESGYLGARYREIVDATGVGDAVSAAIMFGMLNEMPTMECMRLGAAAASLTLQTNETVVPNLSLDLLFDHLT
jgi:pseudouridine kinase